MLKISVSGMPNVPKFMIESSTETEINVRWNHTELGNGSKSFLYGIQCGSDRTISIVEIEDDQYRCILLTPGTFYTISFVVLNHNKEIQRHESSFAVTRMLSNHRVLFMIFDACTFYLVLPKVKITDLVYDWNRATNDSIIIEWQGPTGVYDSIEVICPTSNTMYAYNTLISTMYSRCRIESTGPMFVTFVTSKSGYDQARIIVPINPSRLLENIKKNSSANF